MNWTEQNINLNFERTRSRTRPRFFFSAVSLIVFTLLWVIVPSDVLYWLLLIPIGVLTWVASNGWRQSLHNVHEVIHHLEES